MKNLLSIKSAIKRIRSAIHDWQHINYSDAEILLVINAGIRFIRRTIADIQPEILMTENKGILQGGEDTIQLEKMPLTIIEVTAGNKIISSVEVDNSPKIFNNLDLIYDNQTPIYGKQIIKRFAEKKLHETNLQHLRNKNFQSEHAKYFYRVGLKTLKLFPVPKNETAYTVRTIDDFEELNFEDETPLLNDFDDFLIEYATMRLSIDNEYDATQEQQILSAIQSQIAQILSPPPAGVLTKGYW